MVTTIIGIAGVALGVAALIVTLSIMNGFQSDIKKKIMDAQAHISVYGVVRADALPAFNAALGRQPGVAAFAPFALGQGILTFDDRSAGVVMKGLEPDAEAGINNLKSSLIGGSWEALSSAAPGAPPPVLLGEELAKSLGAWTGDEVILVSPKSASSVGIMPKMKKFRVAGLIRTGYFEFDNSMAYCRLRDASDFFGLAGGINGAGIRLKDMEKAGEGARLLRERLGFGYSVKTYADMNRTLFAALKLEKFVMSLVLALIILVATFNIASNLLMLSVEKLRDIGVLRSMGAGPGFVRRVFFWEGNLIALSGITLGLLAGTGISVFIAVYPVLELPADIYYISRVPVEIRLWDLARTAAVSYALCMLSTIYPALKASRISPVDAIRYG